MAVGTALSHVFPFCFPFSWRGLAGLIRSRFGVSRRFGLLAGCRRDQAVEFLFQGECVSLQLAHPFFLFCGTFTIK